MDSKHIHVEEVNMDNPVTVASLNVSTNDQLDSSSKEEENSQTPELKNKVFDNELIRDQIFDYVFSSNRSGKILVNQNVLTCRLVDHAWLDYTTSRLQQSGYPEYILVIQHESNKENQNFGPKKYQVFKFLDTWVDYPGAGSRIPLFKMEITPYRSSMEFCVQSLIKCLTRCGNGLHHLTLNLQYAFRNDDDQSGANCTNFVATTGEINPVPSRRFVRPGSQ